MTEGDSTQYDPVKHRHIFTLSNALLIFSLLIPCQFEAMLIPSVWIRPQLHIDGFSAFTVQLMVLLPAFVILMLRFAIGHGMKKGQISPSFAEPLSLQIPLLLIIVYGALMRLLLFLTH
jgi:hypothetical protein